MLTYRLTEDGRLAAPSDALVAYHGLLHLVGDDGAKFMAIFTHGQLETLDPIVEALGDSYRCLGRGVLWARLVMTRAEAMPDPLRNPTATCCMDERSRSSGCRAA
jgi:hypothetical protein